MLLDPDDRTQKTVQAPEAIGEGGPPAQSDRSLGGGIWPWLHSLILLKPAPLWIIGVLIAIGLVLVKWDALVAYYDHLAVSAGTSCCGTR